MVGLFLVCFVFVSLSCISICDCLLLCFVCMFIFNIYSLDLFNLIIISGLDTLITNQNHVVSLHLFSSYSSGTSLLTFLLNIFSLLLLILK